MKKFKKISAIVCLVMICNIFMSALPILDSSRETVFTRASEENIIAREGNVAIITFEVYSTDSQNLRVYRDGAEIDFKKEIPYGENQTVLKWSLNKTCSGGGSCKYIFYINKVELSDEAIYSFEIADKKCETVVFVIPMG